MIKNNLKIIFVLIGTIIGAGFASGKEIFLFFSKYGNLGIVGIFISNFLTCLIIYKSIKLIKLFNLNSYDSFVSLITNNKNNFLVKVFSIIINIFLYVSFIIMISGFGTFFYEIYNINIYITIFIVSLICFYLFNNNINNIVKINNILIPILIIIMIYFSFKKININLNINIFNNIFNNLNWLIDAILYSSYNSILLIPVIISLNKLIINLNLKNIKYISFFTFFILTILSLSIINLLFSIDNILINSLDIPILFITKNMGSIYHFIYSIIIIIAIFTSAISSGYSFINIFIKNNFFKYISAIICFSTLIFSKINFSILISNLYPFFGFLGILQILYLLLKKTPKTDIN